MMVGQGGIKEEREQADAATAHFSAFKYLDPGPSQA